MLHKCEVHWLGDFIHSFSKHVWHAYVLCTRHCVSHVSRWSGRILGPRILPAVTDLAGGTSYMGPAVSFSLFSFSINRAKVRVFCLFLFSQRCRKRYPGIIKIPTKNYLYPNLMFLNRLQVLNPHVFLPPAHPSGRDPGHGGSQQPPQKRVPHCAARFSQELFSDLLTLPPTSNFTNPSGDPGITP